MSREWSVTNIHDSDALGPIPQDDTVCAVLNDANQQILMETYAYEVGFFRFNWHASLEIMLVLQGHLKAYTENGVYELHEDDVLVINPNAGHASILQTPHTVALVLHISQDHLESLCSTVPFPFIACCSTEETRSELSFCIIRSCVSAIYQALSSGRPLDRIFATAQEHLLLTLLLRDFSQGAPTPAEQKLSLQQKKTVHAIIKYINRHFREKISLQDLADVSQMNASYISTYLVPPESEYKM